MVPPATRATRCAREEKNDGLRPPVVVALVHVFFILLSKEGAHAVVRINEIADKGSDGVCEGEDWIELYNDSPNAVQLDGYVLHDDQYPENAEEKFTFASWDGSRWKRVRRFVLRWRWHHRSEV